MTQDQYGQATGPGYVVRGDAVPEGEEYETEQSKPMTRFQKVASALRGDRTDQDEADRDELDRDEAYRAQATSREAENAAGPTEARTGGTATGTGAGASRGDYWDEPGTTAAGHEEAVALTNPDVPVAQAERGAADYVATEPDMFGTTRHEGNGTASAPPAEGAGGQVGAARIADAPATETTAGGVPAGGVPAGGVPAPGAGATGTTGRHASDTPADDDLRPGEAAGALGDFSDLTFGNLIPDAAHYTEQWQQIQFRFVDDPHGSVTEAADVVAQVTAKMEAAIQERQRAIAERQRAIAEQQRSLRGRWGDDANADTEALRETLRMYKTFLDQLIGPRAS
jgi:hypothetical protein